MDTKKLTQHSKMDLEKWSSSDKSPGLTEVFSHSPLVLGTEQAFVSHAIQGGRLSADQPYSLLCSSLLEQFTVCKKAMLTTSCTDALEMAALLADTQAGDEIIMASFNFVSAPNAFVLRGAKIVFVDIQSDTLNIDPDRIRAAITLKTKVIVVMHYAGVACEMDKIMDIANEFGLLVIEDAAHAMGSFYQNKHLGTIGHLGAISFHETKNIHCGEGGALLINDTRFIDRAYILKDKGTNRREFFNGKVNKYTWVDIGSSFGLGELNAAYLYAQLQSVEEVTKNRVTRWKEYAELFQTIPGIDVPENPGNGHIFYIKMKDENAREFMIEQLKKYHIHTTSHYEPLHLSLAGERYSVFHGDDTRTVKSAGQLLRFPLYHDLTTGAIHYIVDRFKNCYDL